MTPTALQRIGMRRLGLGVLYLFWWAGLLLMKLAPAVAAVLLGESSQDPGTVLGWAVIRIAEFLGALLILRAFVGFTALGRSDTRRTRLFAGGLLLYLVLTPLSPEWIGGFFLLAIPWLWSFRWRAGLGAGLLLLASATALVSFILLLVTTTPDPLEDQQLRLLTRLSAAVTALAIVYSLLSLFASAGRIHLSIKRIRSRLISSHILAGVIPFILTVLFLLLVGALFLSTYRGSIGLRALETTSRSAGERIVGVLAADGTLDPLPFGEDVEGQTILVRVDELPVRIVGETPTFAPDSLLATDMPSSEAPILWDGRTLFLRARLDTMLAGRDYRIEALAPIDSIRMVRISELVGVPVRVDPSWVVETANRGIQLSARNEDGAEVRAIGPERSRKGDLPGGATVFCLGRTDGGWELSMLPILSSAGFAEPFLSLFWIARGNPLASIVLTVLIVIAVFFLGAIWVTVAMVFQMGRSITRAVHALTRATGALGAGKLGHRIEIAGKDELWSVATSFNEMAEGLEQIRRVERETHRLEEELRLAREIQTRLLPSGPPVLDRLELAGLSLPARQVGGDYFDYLVLEDGQVGLAVADVSGKGAPAALLMSSFRASLRTQDLATLGPAEVLGRLNRFIHASVDPGKFITAFLALIDPATGCIRYANAGHDPPLVVQADGAVEELTGGGLILGMLPQIAYEEARAEIDPGSLVAIFTDGVTEAQNGEGEFFGIERLSETLRVNRQRSCSEVVREIVTATEVFSGGAAQADDITMILARRR